MEAVVVLLGIGIITGMSIYVLHVYFKNNERGD